MIRLGAATREMTDDELEERASYVLRSIHTVAGALRPALNAPEISDGELLRRLGEIADAAETKGP